MIFNISFRNRPAIVGITICFLSASTTLFSQSISGSFVPPSIAPATIDLWDTKGSDHHKLDSVTVDRNGAFVFNNDSYAAGFYQLSIHDTDHVDIILDPREKEIVIRFDGTPLQENITVLRSMENQRMWEFKAVSRECQAKLLQNSYARNKASYNDTVARAWLDSMDANAKAEKERNLDRLIAQDSASFFGHMVLADRALMTAIPKGFFAIRDAFDWTDPRLVRSAIHDKAVMALLQNTPMDWIDGLNRACDSVLKWSAPEPLCWTQTRSFVVRLFQQYGPDMVTQHLVDAYVTGPGSLVPPDDVLLDAISELIRVSIGAKGPDVRLPDPIAADTVDLSSLLKNSKYTALFFYSSTCDHCHDQMPGLRQLYADQHDNGFGLIGIALDADTSEFKVSIARERINWPCYTELLGWGSPAAKAYAVRSTPAFFVLSSSGEIVAKPYDTEGLRTFLEEHLR